MGSCVSKDMAICIVMFNPANTKRLLMNYHYVVNQFKLKKLPVFTLELAFGEPQIADAIHVRGNSIMFHKERLCRLLETKIPPEFKKLAFVDADILFDDESWYYKASKLLDTHDIVQPFETCSWLDLTYTEKTLTRETCVKMIEPVYNSKYHPGFAWCFRREWYNKVGFFDWAVSGSGDALSVAAWMGKSFPVGFKSCPSSIQLEYNKFTWKPRPRITYLKDVEVTHLYHGSRQNRQYTERHNLLEVFTDITMLIRINKDGVYEWVRADIWNPRFLKYFKDRNDDDLGLELDRNTVLTS